MERLLTYDDIHKYTLDIIQQMDADNYTPHLVAGFCRGGMLPAIILSHYYKAKFLPIELSLRDGASKSHIEYNSLKQIDDAMRAGQNVIVIDDISDSGNTFLDLLDGLYNILNPSRKFQEHLRTAALQKRYTSEYNPTYISEYITTADWQIYPWEITNGKNE